MPNKPDRRSPERLALTLLIRIIVLVILARFGYVNMDYLLDCIVGPSNGVVHGRQTSSGTRADEYSASLASGRVSKWRLYWGGL